MASKTYAELAVASDVQDADLLASYRGTGPLKSLTALIYANYAIGLVAGASGHKFGYLDTANTVSALQTVSINTAVTAADYIALKPTDYGTGKPGLFFSKTTTATLWELKLYDGTNNAGTLSVKVGTFALTGALTVSAAATFSAGIDQTGSTKQNVTAVAALNIDVSAGDWFTKSISGNSTLTISGATASRAQAVLLDLTISSSPTITWPASVKWSGGVAPTLPNGRSLVGLITDDGGTTWIGVVGAVNVS